MGYTPDDVRAAYRSLAKAHHPDHSNEPYDFTLLQKDRDACLKNAEREQQLTACERCAGKGRTPGTGFATKPCNSCNGTGLRRKS